MACTSFFKILWALRNIILLVIAFLLPIFFLMDASLESRCAYVMITMATLWVTGALPIAVTALTPLFLLPLLEVQSSQEVSKNYFNDTSALFLVGLIFAVAMHEVNLHKRIAMRITMILGTSPKAMIFGLMLPTWFLSMWISNSATTSMMLPILIAVCEQTTAMDEETEAEGSRENEDNNDTQDNQLMKTERRTPKTLEQGTVRHDSKHLNRGFALGVAYAASIGGIATLNGSLANLVFQAHIDNCCKTADKERQDKMMAFIKREYKKLGNMRFGEIEVMAMFVGLTLMFLFRDIPGVGGWGDAFVDVDGRSTVTDATVAVLMATLLFILPNKLPNQWNSLSGISGPGYAPILTWPVAEKKIAWGVILLFGGGFALADASNTSGLSRLIGCELRVLKDLDPWLMNLVLCLIVTCFTEIKSNTTTSTLMMPIMFELSMTVGIHPLYLMIPTCIACSFSFMLPVASPSNAMVFSTGTVRILDMAMTGFVQKILAVGVLTLAINTWGTVIFGLDAIPEIFINSTVVSVCPVLEI
ncbi:solute carrier family 13 member 2-like isoform X3 [Argopecten irradians]|uniref:solute carrier family 13 member 2-like isoform X3 n=1 Tax=Argopecten irradians TaxID=31199 RepID=UPI003710F591